VVVTVDAHGLNGHGDHPGDLIPAPPNGCPTGPADTCKKQDLPCSSIPEVPNHAWLLGAVALAGAGSLAQRRRRRRTRRDDDAA
jgi:hypothetical protein